MRILKSIAVSVLFVALIVPNAVANVVDPPDLSVDGISPTMLREKLPVPLYFENYPNNFTWLQAGHAFKGGQDAINSQVSHVQTTAMNNGDSTIICEGYSDSRCAGQQKSADIVLAVCGQAVQGPCVKGLRIGTDSNLKEATFDRYVDNTTSADFRTLVESSAYSSPTQSVLDFQDTLTWAGNNSRSLPDASSPSLWTVPGSANVSGSETYLVRFRVSFIFQDNDKPFFTDMAAEVIPYKLISRVQQNGFHPPLWYTREDTDADPDGDEIGGAYITESFPASASSPLASFDNPQAVDPVLCAFEETDKCGVALKFSENERVELNLRIPKDFGGWFHGRLSDTKVELSSFDEKLNSLTVNANPVIVPISSLQFEPCKPRMESYAEKFFYSQSEKDNFCARDQTRGLASWGQWSPSSSKAMENFTNFEDLIPAQAKGEISLWSLGTLPFDAVSGSCFGDTSKVQGVISTNAMIYQAGIPVLTNRGFSYRLAGTHLDMNGQIIRGKYTLQLRSEVARCIYNLGNKKIKAAIKVSAAAGQTKESETTFEEKDGWLRITANNFTFSESSVDLGITADDSELSSSAQPSSSSKVLNLAKKSKTSKSDIASIVGLVTSKKSSIKLSILNSSKKICKVVGSNLITMKVGSCGFRITVANPRPAAVKISGSVPVARGQVISANSMATQLGASIPGGSKVTISIASSSKKVCFVSGSKVKGKNSGSCLVTLRIQGPQPKPIKQTSIINVS